MKLEYLYPELGNLFGDSANMRYLRQCLPDADYVETPLGATPAFLTDETVSFVYSGPMTERGQRLALSHLAPLAADFQRRVEAGVHFLFTGNSLELLGKRIDTAEGPLEGLGLVDLTARQALMQRYNGLFLGQVEDIQITAFNSRFSHAAPGPSVTGFAQVTRGVGLEPGCGFEGVRLGNLVGTYLLGPLLVMNPLLTQRLLRSLGAGDVRPAFYDQAMAAYEKRLAEFSDPRRKLD